MYSIQKEKFYDYYELLIEKNKVMNLTTITEFDEVVEKHFLDSLAIIKVVDLHSASEKDNYKVIDMGTGAGFPGIPLKIVFPDLQITLTDSLNKRILFLDEVIKTLDLKKINTIHARAEELARNKKHRENYDLCVSRAVANLSTLSEYCIPFLKLNGRFVSYKSGDIENEMQSAKNAISILGGELEKIHRFHLNNQGRSFVIINKVRNTPNNYPRKAGIPAKIPLK